MPLSFKEKVSRNENQFHDGWRHPARPLRNNQCFSVHGLRFAPGSGTLRWQSPQLSLSCGWSTWSGIQTMHGRAAQQRAQVWTHQDMYHTYQSSNKLLDHSHSTRMRSPNILWCLKWQESTYVGDCPCEEKSIAKPWRNLASIVRSHALCTCHS